MPGMRGMAVCAQSLTFPGRWPPRSGSHAQGTGQWPAANEEESNPLRAPAPNELKSCLWRWLSLELGHAGQLARYRESRVHMLGAEQMPARMPAGLACLADGVYVEVGLRQLGTMGCSGN